MTDAPEIAIPRTDTAPILVPQAAMDRAIQAAKEELRLEWMANIDRVALERVHRAAITGIALVAILALVVAVVGAFVVESRTRIDYLERR